MAFTPHFADHNWGMKYLEEVDPIILSGTWSTGSQTVKIYQFIDFIIFQMDDTIGSAKIRGIVGSGDILEITWPSVINQQGWASGAVHRTLLKVMDEDHLELVDDTVHEAGKLVAHKNRGGKWVRSG